jgi:hypothetical protein
MPAIRKIKKVLKSKPTLEGAGVRLKRVFGLRLDPELDPFLLLDDFYSNNPDDYLPGFPWHPHRGIETITYMLDGSLEHGDSMGNKGVVAPGAIQWMTAGSGIVHQEMPKGRPDGLIWGFQLWANLPASHKMMEPRYQGIHAAKIPVAALGGGIKAKVICGEVAGVRGPVQDIMIDPEYIDITFPARASFTHPVRRGRTVFAYVIEGAGLFEPDSDPYAHEVVGSSYFDMKREKAIGAGSLVLFGDGEEIAITAGVTRLRFLLVSGKPIGEPVAWWGPIVMNTQEELRVAFDEYERGSFLKHAKK